MHKKKKSILILSIGFSLLLLSFIILKTTNYPLFSQTMGVSITNKYDTISDIENDSSIIVNATVEGSDSFIFKDVPFTISELKVNEVYKGNIEKGNSINLLETGGVIDNVEYTVETDTTLKRSEDAILFLTEYEGPILENTKKYVVSGVYQGKFRMNEDNSIIPSELNDGELSEIRLIEDLNLEEIN